MHDDRGCGWRSLLVSEASHHQSGICCETLGAGPISCLLSFPSLPFKWIWSQMNTLVYWCTFWSAKNKLILPDSFCVHFHIGNDEHILPTTIGHHYKHKIHQACFVFSNREGTLWNCERSSFFGHLWSFPLEWYEILRCLPDRRGENPKERYNCSGGMSFPALGPLQTRHQAREIPTDSGGVDWKACRSFYLRGGGEGGAGWKASGHLKFPTITTAPEK